LSNSPNSQSLRSLTTNAALVGIDFGKLDFEASLQELDLLTQSAGAKPVVTITGRRHSPDAKLFIGSG
jgi:GTPase